MMRYYYIVVMETSMGYAGELVLFDTENWELIKEVKEAGEYWHKKVYFTPKYLEALYNKRNIMTVKYFVRAVE